MNKDLYILYLFLTLSLLFTFGAFSMVFIFDGWASIVSLIATILGFLTVIQFIKIINNYLR